jgi:3-oxoacyl-(acyl-carrier-protein) synthase
MESEEHARQRGAEIHAWLSGYGNACDAFHQTASSENGEGAYLAMKEALEMAQLSPSQIDYVNAHGTGTPNNDASESAALKRIFEDRMPRVSSTKSFTGHTTSASGSIESVICLLAMQHHFVPANLGWQHQMAEGITPTMGETNCKVEHVMCNSFGFGGNDSSLVFSTSKDTPATDSASDISHFPIKELSRVEITSEDQLSEIREFVKPLEARHMGKIMKSSLLSSLKALKQAGIETPDAIITATSLGCLEFSENLLRQLSENGEQMLSPTWFMQSTHNTIGSNIAIRTHCHGYNATYTQEKKSLEWALRDAQILLATGKAKTVLVGLHEELTPFWNSLLRRVIKPLNSQFSVLSSPADYNIHSIAMVLTCGK